MSSNFDNKDIKREASLAILNYGRCLNTCTWSVTLSINNDHIFFQMISNSNLWKTLFQLTTVMYNLVVSQRVRLFASHKLDLTVTIVSKNISWERQTVCPHTSSGKWRTKIKKKISQTEQIMSWNEATVSFQRQSF